MPRHALWMVLVACSSAAPPKPTPIPTPTSRAPVIAAPLTPAAPDPVCKVDLVDNSDPERYPDGERLATSKDACAVADNNLAREEAQILAARSPEPIAVHRAWDHKTRPQFLGAIQKRFELRAPELAAIDKNGFAVPARLEMPSYSYGYHEIFQSQLPVYITADSIFHAVFASHDAVVERLESLRLSPMLAQALDDMHCALGAAAADYPPDVARDLDLYLLVARTLLGTSDKIHSAFDDHALEAQATQIVAKVTAASELETVTLFGRPRLVDFTQYGPRGHYAKPEMQPYFRASMWASRLEFNLVSRSSRSSAPGPEPDPSETPREAIDALALADLATRSGAAKRIDDLDHAWAALAGTREDVSIAQLAVLRTQVGSLVAPDAFARLKAAIGDRFKRTTRLHPMPEGSRELPAIATLLGPRIVADAHAIMPIVNGAVPGRTRIGVADIAYMFGLDRAKTYLAGDLAKFPNLGDQLEVARKIVRGAPTGDDLYGAWLAAIRGLGQGPTGIVPSFATTELGQDLRLNTIAAAYGQLKHNYVLVAGQPYAEFGCEIPDGYVEAVPAAYDALIEYAARGEKLAALLDPKDHAEAKAHFVRMGQVLRVLRKIVDDELAGRALTASERHWLGMVAELDINLGVDTTGHPPMYTGWYFDLFFDRQGDGMRGADFVADTFTSADGIAYAGATAPRLGVFVVDTNGAPRAFVGPVARAYEVFGPLAQRLTDESAAKLAAHDEPWATGYTLPAAAKPSSLQLSYDTEAKAFVFTSDHALGRATLEILDHHRVVKQTLHVDIQTGQTRLPVRDPHAGAIYLEIGAFRDFVPADAYGEIHGAWGTPPPEQ